MNRRTLILTFFILLCLPKASISSNLPDLGSPDLKDYDSQTETALGKAFSTALHKYYDLIQDPIVLSYIRRIGEKIVSETGQNRVFSFNVINNNEINAFAGPNGVIGIHTGLINAAKSEDELASVIAHEIAHVTQRHLSRRFEYQNNTSVASIATLIAAILIGSQDSAAGMATYLGGMGLSTQEQLKNSRIHEAEADYFGIQYLQDAGYNPEAMASFFARLSKSAQLYEFKPPEILLTHPVTDNRLAKARARASQVKTTHRALKTDSLRLIQIRLVHLHNNRPDNYQNLTFTPSEICYKQNLAALYKPNSQTKTNLSCIEKAIKKHPEQRLYKIMKANILAKEAPEKSEQYFKYLAEIYPSDFSILYYHASMLNKNGRASDAASLLTKLTPKFHYQYLLYSKLARIYANLNQTNKVYYYDALANYNIGNLKKTQYLINQAIKKTKDKNSKLYSHLQRIQSELIENKEETIK